MLRKLTKDDRDCRFHMPHIVWALAFKPNRLKGTHFVAIRVETIRREEFRSVMLSGGKLMAL
jgi:hypothetical protein